MNEPAKISVNRPLVGILAAVCLVAGGGMLFSTSTAALGGTLLRVGVLLGALWLALPLRKSATAAARFSPFVLVGIVGLLMFAVRRPGAVLPSLVGLGIVGLLLRPWRSFSGAASPRPRTGNEERKKKNPSS